MKATDSCFTLLYLGLVSGWSTWSWPACATCSLNGCLQKDSVTVQVQERIMNSSSRHTLLRVCVQHCTDELSYWCSGVRTTGLVGRILWLPCDVLLGRVLTAGVSSWCQETCCMQGCDLLKNARSYGFDAYPSQANSPNWFKWDQLPSFSLTGHCLKVLSLWQSNCPLLRPLHR